jgi:lactonase family protein with 7-bladed beta-propeller
MANVFLNLDFANLSVIYASTVDPITSALVPMANSPVSLSGVAISNTSSLASTNDGLFYYLPCDSFASLLAVRYNPSDNTLTEVGTYPLSDPANVAGGAGIYITPDNKYLYTTDQNGVGIFGYSLDAITGAATMLPGFPVSAPTQDSYNGVQMCIDTEGKFLFVALDPGGQGSYYFSAYPINTDGSLGAPVSTAPSGVPNAPFSPISMAGKYLAVGDQGSNQIDIYSYDSSGNITFLNAYNVGVSPTWLCFDPVGNFLYSPMNGDNVVYGFYLDTTTGDLTAMPGSPWACPSFPYFCTAFRNSKTGVIIFGVGDGTYTEQTLTYNLTTGVVDPTSLMQYMDASGGSAGQSLVVASTFNGDNMSTTIPNFNHEFLFSNLDTYNTVIPVTGTFVCAVKLTDITPPNGISIVIQQNGVTVATAPTPAVSQNEMNLEVLMACTDGDVISVIVTSSTFVDSNPNHIKGFINIYQGFN